MSNKIGLALGAVLIACFLGFLMFAVGGLEAYQPVFEIVVPETVNGVICATSRPGTTEDINQVVRHEVTPEGLLEVDGDVLRSHRPKRLFVRTASGQITEVPKEKLMPIFTENDLASGQQYTVMWLGPAEGWEAFRKAKSGERFCVNRFSAKSSS